VIARQHRLGWRLLHAHVICSRQAQTLKSRPPCGSLQSPRRHMLATRRAPNDNNHLSAPIAWIARTTAALPHSVAPVSFGWLVRNWCDVASSVVMACSVPGAKIHTEPLRRACTRCVPRSMRIRSVTWAANHASGNVL
jgi:hypothetical protein